MMSLPTAPEVFDSLDTVGCPECDGRLYFWGFPKSGLVRYLACEDCRYTLFLPGAPKSRGEPEEPPGLHPAPVQCHGCGHVLTPRQQCLVQTVLYENCPVCGRHRITVDPGHLKCPWIESGLQCPLETPQKDHMAHDVLPTPKGPIVPPSFKPDSEVNPC